MDYGLLAKVAALGFTTIVMIVALCTGNAAVVVSIIPLAVAIVRKF